MVSVDDMMKKTYILLCRQEDTELGRLMHDLHCKRAEEMYSEILAKRVYELKETQEGVNKMCQEMEQIFSEGQRYGEKRGEKRGEKIGEKRGPFRIVLFS